MGGGGAAVTPSVLLDTHAFLWYAAGHPSMPLSAREAVVAAGLPTVVAQLGFRPLAVEVEDGDLAGSLAQEHGDPFDRVLVAQAVRRGLALVSDDAALDVFGIARVW